MVGWSTVSITPSVVYKHIIFISNRSSLSQLVTLHLDSKPISVLCHTGDGGWTPVMKIDGNKVR